MVGRRWLVAEWHPIMGWVSLGDDYLTRWGASSSAWFHTILTGRKATAVTARQLFDLNQRHAQWWNGLAPAQQQDMLESIARGITDDWEL